MVMVCYREYHAVALKAGGIVTGLMGPQKTLTIGNYPDLNLRGVRKQRDIVLSLRKAGVDPSTE